MLTRFVVIAYSRVKLKRRHNSPRLSEERLALPCACSYTFDPRQRRRMWQWNSISSLMTECVPQLCVLMCQFLSTYDWGNVRTPRSTKAEATFIDMDLFIAVVDVGAKVQISNLEPERGPTAACAALGDCSNVLDC